MDGLLLAQEGAGNRLSIGVGGGKRSEHRTHLGRESVARKNNRGFAVAHRQGLGVCKRMDGFWKCRDHGWSVHLFEYAHSFCRFFGGLYQHALGLSATGWFFYLRFFWFV